MADPAPWGARAPELRSAHGPVSYAIQRTDYEGPSARDITLQQALDAWNAEDWPAMADLFDPDSAEHECPPVMWLTLNEFDGKADWMNLGLLPQGKLAYKHLDAEERVLLQLDYPTGGLLRRSKPMTFRGDCIPYAMVADLIERFFRSSVRDMLVSMGGDPSTYQPPSS